MVQDGKSGRISANKENIIGITKVVVPRIPPAGKPVAKLKGTAMVKATTVASAPKAAETENLSTVQFNLLVYGFNEYLTLLTLVDGLYTI